MNDKIEEYKNIMKREGLDEIVIDSFVDYYKQLLRGSTGKLSESKIKPPGKNKIKKIESLVDYQNPPFAKLAIVKLNGGLGTSMGLEKVKSLLKVKSDFNFLDIIVKQDSKPTRADGRRNSSVVYG